MTGLNHRYFVRNLSVPTFTDPTSIAGLVAWYDASNAGSITASGGSVSQWNDLSGNLNHLVQATGANQPVTGTRTQNGLNVLDFNIGGNTNMQWASGTQGGPFTITCSFTTIDSSNQIFFGQVSGVTFGLAGGPNWYTFQSFGKFDTTPSAPAFNAQTHAYASVADMSANSRWVNGVKGAATDPGVTSATALRVGRGAGDPGESAAFYFHEIAYYNSFLADADVTSLHTYYKAKWNTA